jgi:hypothetical protein
VNSELTPAFVLARACAVDGAWVAALSFAAAAQGIVDVRILAGSRDERQPS